MIFLQEKVQHQQLRRKNYSKFKRSIYKLCYHQLKPVKSVTRTYLIPKYTFPKYTPANYAGYA